MIQTTIRLPKDLHNLVKREAKKRGISFNAYVIGLLWETKIDNGNGEKVLETYWTGNST